jgi:hypothetical protein
MLRAGWTMALQEPVEQLAGRRAQAPQSPAVGPFSNVDRSLLWIAPDPDGGHRCRSVSHFVITSASEFSLPSK